MTSVHSISHLNTWKPAGLSDIEFVWQKDHIDYPNHIHEGFNIDYIQSGTLEYRLRNRSFLVRPGTFLWIHQHEVHSARAVGSGEHVIKSVFLSERLVRALASKLGIKQIHSWVNPIVSDRQLAEKIGSAYRTVEESPDAIELGTRFKEIVSALLLKSSRIQKPSCKKSHEEEVVNIIKEYLLAHSAENICLKQLADMVALNKFYLARLFKNHVGLPPYSYLMQIRIARARNSLLAGKSPSEVAVAVGFSDQSHLTRVFRRVTGMTPRSFARLQSPAISPNRFSAFRPGPNVMPLW